MTRGETYQDCYQKFAVIDQDKAWATNLSKNQSLDQVS
jgi:hypothetical protein